MLDSSTVEGETPSSSQMVKTTADYLDGVQNADGDTLVHSAAKWSFEIVQFLMQNGANINIENKNGETPLHVATSSGSVQIVELLLDEGAKIDKKTLGGLTPLHEAAWGGESTLEICAFLINRGADIHAKTHLGMTPLHWAACRNVGQKEKIIRFFLAHGADPHAQHTNGNIPFDLACRHLCCVEEFKGALCLMERETEIKGERLDELLNPHDQDLVFDELSDQIYQTKKLLNHPEKNREEITQKMEKIRIELKFYTALKAKLEDKDRILKDFNKVVKAFEDLERAFQRTFGDEPT